MNDVVIRSARAQDLPHAADCMREVINRDLGGYQDRWHRDVLELERVYVRAPRAVLLVALDGSRVLATTALRPCSLSVPPNPEWLARRYNTPDTCQLVRVWVRAEARRRGIARQLVTQAVTWAHTEAKYQTVYLHTDTAVAGAEPFWRSMPTVEVHDARPDPWNTVHFEIDSAKLLCLPDQQ